MNDCLRVSPDVSIPLDEIELNAIRAQGPGGQNVNKVSSAIHLRFDVRASSLPEHVKARLLATRDDRLTAGGVLVVKARRHRTQEKNRADALSRLAQFVADALVVRAPRRPTKPSRAARQRRLDSKAKRGKVKSLRRSPVE